MLLLGVGGGSHTLPPPTTSTRLFFTCHANIKDPLGLTGGYSPPFPSSTASATDDVLSIGLGVSSGVVPIVAARSLLKINIMSCQSGFTFRKGCYEKDNKYVVCDVKC